MKYKTQMEAAKNGFVTEEMKIVAKKENVSEEFLLEKIALYLRILNLYFP